MALEANDIALPKSAQIFQEWLDRVTDEELEQYAKEMTTWATHNKRKGMVRFALDTESMRPSRFYIQGQTVIPCFFDRDDRSESGLSPVERMRDAITNGLRDFLSRLDSITGSHQARLDGYRNCLLLAEDVPGIDFFAVVNPSVKVRPDQARAAIIGGLNSPSGLHKLEQLIAFNQDAAREVFNDLGTEKLLSLTQGPGDTVCSILAIRVLGARLSPEAFQALVDQAHDREYGSIVRIIQQHYIPSIRVAMGVHDFRSARSALHNNPFVAELTKDLSPVIELLSDGYMIESLASLRMSNRAKIFPTATFLMDKGLFDGIYKLCQAYTSVELGKHFAEERGQALVILDLIQKGRLKPKEGE